MKRLSKLNCGQQKFFLLLSYQPGKNQIELTVSDGARSWTGKFGDKDFAEWSERTKLTLSEFRSQTIKALSGESLNGRKFEYNVEEDKTGSITLSWKRILDDEDIKFHLGSAKLKPDQDLAKSMIHLLESSVQLTSQLQDDIQQRIDEIDRLTSERAVLLQRLEKCVSIKEDTEKDLFSKFIVVVNNKKSKICELKRKLEQHEPQGIAPTENRPSAEKSRKMCAIFSDDDSDHGNLLASTNATADDSEGDYNTDDELKKSSSSLKKIRDEREKPGASNGGQGVCEDDGLILDDDDDDEDDPLPTMTKRARRARPKAVAKKSSSKTLIPHTTAAAADPQPSTSRSSVSLRKSSSKGSSHNLDVNNLIDDMD